MRILSAKNTGPIGWKQGNNTMNSENIGGGGRACGWQPFFVLYI